MKKKILAGILTAVITMSLLAGCGPSSDKREASQQDGKTAAADTDSAAGDGEEAPAAKEEKTETAHLKILMPFMMRSMPQALLRHWRKRRMWSWKSWVRLMTNGIRRLIRSCRWGKNTTSLLLIQPHRIRRGRPKAW